MILARKSPIEGGQMRIEKKMAEMGLEIPVIEVRTDVPLIPGVKVGNVLYVSGATPAPTSGRDWAGKVPTDVSAEEAKEAARWCGVQLLAQAKFVIGDLDRVKRVVKVLGMVNSETDFGGHPEVINGCSEFFVEVFGEMGRHARSAVGMASLPSGQAVEIEAIFEVE